MSASELRANDDCPYCSGTGFDISQSDVCACVQKAQPKRSSFAAALTDALTGNLPNPEGFLMTAGKHKGELITRVPPGYLKWMVNAGHHDADMAEAEIQRRGTKLPDLEVSAHSIDRASLRLIPAWKGTRQRKEGLHSWLARMAMTALDNPAFRDGCHQHMGIVFVFAYVGRWPVLKSVWPANKDNRDDDEGE